MSNTFGNSFTEQELGSYLQILRMFNESETDHSLFSCPQLVLNKRRRYDYRIIASLAI